jgi:hypothetical protein
MDLHLAQLTVLETLNFARLCQEGLHPEDTLFDLPAALRAATERRKRDPEGGSPPLVGGSPSGSSGSPAIKTRVAPRSPVDGAALPGSPLAVLEDPLVTHHCYTLVFCLPAYLNTVS